MPNQTNQSGKIQIGVIVSDTEFQEYHAKRKKEQLLADMLSATNKSFSVKNISKHKKEKNTEVYNANLGLMETKPVSKISIEEEDWDAILEKASELSPSPIEDITTSEMGAFRLEDIGIKDEVSSYQNMFKKEQAMLAEILKDVTEQSKNANAKLKDMTKKSAGYGGVSKTYPELLSASNSLNSTRLSIIKEMANLKKTVADLEFKKLKEMGGEKDGTSNDDVADSFFKQIVSNRKGFIESSMPGGTMGGLSYSDSGNTNIDPLNIDYEKKDRSQMSYDENDGNEQYVTPKQRKFNITSPLHYDNDYQSEYDENEADPYGYIRNENRGISICVERYQDGRLQFVAIDKDGESVDDYELPGDDLLLDLSIRPLSKYATDSEGRRYRILDIDPDGIDISDIIDDDSESLYEDNRL